jgi:hypothetical protein
MYLSQWVTAEKGNSLILLFDTGIDLLTQISAKPVCISDTVNIHVYLWFVRLVTSFSLSRSR